MMNDLPTSTPKLCSDDIAADKTNYSETDGDFVVPEFDIEYPEKIEEFFELSKVLHWITANDFKRVALQLPDAYLGCSFEISQYLEKNSTAKVYVLGDTSYRNCCIDDVAAEHANCDSLVHFGDACLTAPSKRLPLLYIFCEFKLDLDNCRGELKCTMSQVEPVENIALIYDASITHQSALVIEIVKEILPTTANLVVCHVNRIGDHSDKLDSSTNISYSSFGRNVPECVHGWLEGSTLIFVGSKGSPLLPLWLMTFVQFTNVLHYSPLEKECKLFKSSASRQLKKRLFLIEKLRDANTVGLVIGTLAVQGFREAITRVRELCKAAHKKLYVFSIGKLNEAKLSNFAGDIDVFILLSCPFGIVLNNEYYKPIVSLFEAEIALNPDRQWYSGSGWTAEFNEITLKGQCSLLFKRILNLLRNRRRVALHNLM
uniref:2-(3-amino-3-carboxypropyl)histidine synthase subunit 2 n=1 Tax=Ditylenchus dipsaci TaxID=166011 RepID=A0A915DHA1_9BILA